MDRAQPLPVPIAGAQTRTTLNLQQRKKTCVEGTASLSTANTNVAGHIVNVDMSSRQRIPIAGLAILTIGSVGPA
jgi:hypothetical protein